MLHIKIERLINPIPTREQPQPCEASTQTKNVSKEKHASGPVGACRRVKNERLSCRCVPFSHVLRAFIFNTKKESPTARLGKLLFAESDHGWHN